MSNLFLLDYYLKCQYDNQPDNRHMPLEMSVFIILL